MVGIWKKLGCQLVLLVILLPFIGAAWNPGVSRSYAWLVVGLAGILGFSVLRSLGTLLIGRDAANHVVGALATDVVRGCTRLVLLPLRALRRLLVR